jgi:hypothetical protein
MRIEDLWVGGWIQAGILIAAVLAATIVLPLLCQ